MSGARIIPIVGDEIAEGFGIGIGDTLTVNVMGRDITGTIANLREIDWGTMGIKFTLVFVPGMLEAAPHTHIATVHADREAESGLRSAVAQAFPNVSAIGVRDVLGDVLAILSRIDAAICDHNLIRFRHDATTWWQTVATIALLKLLCSGGNCCVKLWVGLHHNR